MEPACVDSCPVNALVFGDIDNPDSPISRYVLDKSPWHLLEEAGTEPSVMYVGGKPPTSGLKEVERPEARMST
jgi:Fe-S-cluster-containing dehydrogenase component